MCPQSGNRKQLEELVDMLSREQINNIGDKLFCGKDVNRIDREAKRLLIEKAEQLHPRKVWELITALEHKAAMIGVRAKNVEDRYFGPTKQSARLRTRISEINILVRKMAFANPVIKQALQETEPAEIAEREAA